MAMCMAPVVITTELKNQSHFIGHYTSGRFYMEL